MGWGPIWLILNLTIGLDNIPRQTVMKKYEF